MTRIISGKWKSRLLSVPQAVTRPTASRVREAIFSTLLHELGSLSDLQVLDLYAGSGALGIEAISRGANNAHFVDNDRVAISIINSNLGGLGHVSTQVVKSNVATYLGQPSAGVAFDLVFMDPPYSVVDAVVEDQVAALVGHGWLNEDAMVVIEREAKSELEWPQGFEAQEPRIYGDTSVWYGRYVGTNASDDEGSDS
jgi:16S rRNA (guanine966-N2)-methyltransferase